MTYTHTHALTHNHDLFAKTSFLHAPALVVHTLCDTIPELFTHIEVCYLTTANASTEKLPPVEGALPLTTGEGGKGKR